MSKRKLFTLKPENIPIYLEKVLIDLDYVPLLILGIDANKQRYIGVSIGNCPAKQWYVTKISLEDLNSLLKGTLSLQKLFLNNRVLWEVFCERNHKGDEFVVKITSNVVKRDRLPDKGFEI